MRRPRFLNSKSAVDSSQEIAASRPDAASLLQEIDVGLASIEATLLDLEWESTQYRSRLVGISGAAQLFDKAGLVSEATAMHEGEQTIGDALTEIERRREAMTETALKLR